jgi:hypothetical protein
LQESASSPVAFCIAQNDDRTLRIRASRDAPLTQNRFDPTKLRRAPAQDDRKTSCIQHDFRRLPRDRAIASSFAAKTPEETL